LSSRWPFALRKSKVKNPKVALTNILAKPHLSSAGTPIQSQRDVPFYNHGLQSVVTQQYLSSRWLFAMRKSKVKNPKVKLTNILAKPHPSSAGTPI